MYLKKILRRELRVKLNERSSGRWIIDPAVNVMLESLSETGLRTL